MEEENQKLLKEFTDKLTLVREDYIRLKKQESVSTRNDVLKVELQTILDTSLDYESLKNSLQNYIDSLLKVEETTNE